MVVRRYWRYIFPGSSDFSMGVRDFGGLRMNCVVAMILKLFQGLINSLFLLRRIKDIGVILIIFR